MSNIDDAPTSPDFDRATRLGAAGPRAEDTAAAAPLAKTTVAEAPMDLEASGAWLTWSDGPPAPEGSGPASQAAADAEYFARACGRALDQAARDRVASATLAAYRFQYIASGAGDDRFLKVLGGLVTEAQMKRIGTALARIVG